MDKRATWQLPLTPIRLIFPAQWNCQPHLNPYSSAVTEGVLLWLENSGAIRSGTPLYETAVNINPGEFVGYAFPDSDYDRLLDIGRLWTAELLWDDIAVEANVPEHSISKQDIFKFFLLEKSVELSGFAGGSGDPFSLLLRSIAEVLITMQKKHGSEFIRGHAEGMYQWYEAARLEESMAEKFGEGHYDFTFEDFFTNRCITVGSTAGMSIEYVYNYTLPAEFHREPTIRRLKDLAAAVCAIGNDVCSIRRDLENNWPSSITVRMALQRLSIDNALDKTVADHIRYCKTFDDTATEMLRDGGMLSKYPFLELYLQQMRLYTSGVTLWETQARRYVKSRLRLDEHALTPKVEFSGL